MGHSPERIAEGIGLIQAGHSYAWVEAETGIPSSTLHDTYKRHLGPNAPDKDEQRRATDERILAGAAAVAETTLRIMAAKLEAGNVDNRTVTAWHSVAAQSYGRLRGWDRGLAQDAPSERWLGALERIAANGGSVELRVQGANPVIDVTPEPDEDA